MNHIIWYPGHDLIIKDIVRAENCYLYDSTGKKYVDLESGVWCTSIGHGHRRIRKIMAEQAALNSHSGFNYTNEIVEDCAREILALFGFTEGKCIFLCSGSESVEFGVRAAQTLSDRPLLMTMNDSYFGAYGSASQRMADEWFCFDWSPCVCCPEETECSQDCPYLASVPFDRIGGFLLEPGSSSGHVRFPPKKLIQKIVEIIRADDGLVLINEVTTGVGRTGEWFGFQHYDISPDIVALGKGIGNGYPVSVTVFAPRIAERLETQPVMYAQSHQNDPLGAVVAREVVRVIREDKLIERSREIAAVLGTGLDKIKTGSKRVKEIRVRGLMAVIELEDDAENSLAIKTHRELINRGYIVGRRPGESMLRIDPSLTIDTRDIEGFIITLTDLLTPE